MTASDLNSHHVSASHKSTESIRVLCGSNIIAQNMSLTSTFDIQMEIFVGKPALHMSCRPLLKYGNYMDSSEKELPRLRNLRNLK